MYWHLIKSNSTHRDLKEIYILKSFYALRISGEQKLYKHKYWTYDILTNRYKMISINSITVVRIWTERGNVFRNKPYLQGKLLYIYYVNNIKMIANDIITLQFDIFVMQIDKLCWKKYKNTAPGNCLNKHNFHICRYKSLIIWLQTNFLYT